MRNIEDLGKGRDRAGDLVERLLSLADTGPEIPSEGAERIKAAVRQEWRRQVRTRRRRRVVGTAAGLAAAAVLALALVLAVRVGQRPGAPAEPVAHLERVRGAVEVVSPTGRAQRFEDRLEHEGVPAGSTIATDSSALAALRLEGGQSLRLDVSTRLRLLSAELVELVEGGLYVDSGTGSSSDVAVRTPRGEVHEIGTRFQVRLEDGPLRVLVRDGSVAVKSDGRMHRLSGGAALRIDADGTVRRSFVSATDPAWDWVQRAAPPFEIEGRSVARLLEWVSEETGLSVEYQEAGLEVFARETVLHGGVSDLTPAQVPDVVLPSCGLEAKVQESRLVITRQRE